MNHLPLRSGLKTRPEPSFVYKVFSLALGLGVGLMIALAVYSAIAK